MTTASAKEKALIAVMIGDPDLTPIRAETRLGRAKTGAEKAKDTRERWKVRRQLAAALVDFGRLGEWDEANRIEIDRALIQLGLDWAECAKRDGDDPLSRATDEMDETTFDEEE